jgi:hypothetical protein
MADIQYLHALDHTKTLVSIHDPAVQDRTLKEFYCLTCDAKMSVRLGKIMSHHFYHLGKIECSKETYLHKLAKTKLFERLTKALEEKNNYGFSLNVALGCKKSNDKFPCPIGTTGELHYEAAFSDHFVQVELEIEHGGVRPDLIVKSDSKLIFIEVQVTHKSSAEKIALGYPIIECLITEEQDIENLLINGFNQRNSKFYNFKKMYKEEGCYLKSTHSQSIKLNIHSGYYDRMIFVEVANSFYSFYCKYSFENFEKPNNWYCLALLYSSRDFFQLNAGDCCQIIDNLTTLLKRTKGRSCFACKFSHIDGTAKWGAKSLNNWGGFCKKKNKRFKQNFSLDCAYFQYREKKYDTNRFVLAPWDY